MLLKSPDTLVAAKTLYKELQGFSETISYVVPEWGALKEDARQQVKLHDNYRMTCGDLEAVWKRGRLTKPEQGSWEMNFTEEGFDGHLSNLFYNATTDGLVNMGHFLAGVAARRSVGSAQHQGALRTAIAQRVKGETGNDALIEPLASNPPREYVRCLKNGFGVASSKPRLAKKMAECGELFESYRWKPDVFVKTITLVLPQYDALRDKFRREAVISADGTRVEVGGTIERWKYSCAEHSWWIRVMPAPNRPPYIKERARCYPENYAARKGFDSLCGLVTESLVAEAACREMSLEDITGGTQEALRKYLHDMPQFM